MTLVEYDSNRQDTATAPPRPAGIRRSSALDARQALARIAQEPPFRIAARAALPWLRPRLATRALWDLSERPQYLLGVYEGARQALRQDVREISVLEFGVAGGAGLLALQREAEAVERETGVGVRVFGFDRAGGLPEPTGGYRDHPEAWRSGDFPMDVPGLLAKLTERTELVLGDVCETVPSFFERRAPPPIGFVAIDLDLYSSTRAALRILSCPESRMLWHVPLYFDDIEFLFNHRWAGELLAIEEFNEEHELLKIDRWYGLRDGRPFPERPYLSKMYVAHDLASVEDVRLERPAATLPLDGGAA